MSFSPSLSSGFTFAKNRSSFVSPQSGMCSFCTEDCAGTCEIAQAAVFGMQTVYPMTTGANQIASEKDYPIDFSHFNINGRCFGAIGAEANYQDAEIYNVNLECTYGTINPVKMTMPVILPALVKMNWKDYFAGAAMAGVSCMVGEDAKSKDANLVMENGKIVDFPMMGEILECFNKYYRGYGQIIPQCDVEDDLVGVPEIAIKKYGAQAIEFKFGQSAKGTQPVNRLKNLEAALAKQKTGAIVRPDPSDPEVQKAYAEGVCPNFYTYGMLPQWTEEYLVKRVNEVREMGAKNVYFKMAGFDRVDLEKVMRIGSKARIDMITFDGAGGGSGYSPSKMMNEWCLPTVCMEHAVVEIAERMKKEGLEVPAIAITGGFASEDQVFKSLAYGNGNVQAVGICRAAMAAAMSGKKIGDMIKSGNIPENMKKYGTTVEEIFGDLADLRAIYGKEANNFPTGAIGVFSYLRKIAFGVQHFGALNRKFDLKYFDRTDLIPLSRDAKDLVDGKWF